MTPWTRPYYEADDDLLSDAVGVSTIGNSG